MKSSIFIICCIFGITLTLDMPSYIPRCSLMDPKLNECIKEKANLAIPHIVKGDAKIGVPSLSPFRIPTAKLTGKHLVTLLTNITVNGFQSFRLTNTSYDMGKKLVYFDANIDVLNIIADYSISNGKLLSRSFSGNGKFNATMVGINIYYIADLVLYEKNGEIYMKLVNPIANVTVQRVYYDFENLQSPDNDDDINAFLNENWRAVHAENKQSEEAIFFTIIKDVSTPIAGNIPLKNIFLP